MRYQCKVEINASLKDVSKHYLDLEWQKEFGLNRKETVEGEAWSTGSVANLYFIVNEKEMVMKETIELNALPDTLIAVYEIGSTRNRCVNRFTEKNGKVIFTMDVEFRFNDEMDIPKIKFINQTQQEMDYFKQYVERKIRE